MSRPRPSPLPLACRAALLLLAGIPGAGRGAEGSGHGPIAPAPAAPALPAARRPAADEIHGLLNLGASLTARGSYDSAEIAYRQVLNAPAAQPAEVKDALLGLAHMHRRQGALTKAAAIYEKYLQEYPGDDRTPDALLELGRTLRDMGVYKLAIARFYSVINSTLKLPAGSFERYQQLAKTAKFEIAETHFQAGEYEEAGKFFTRLRLLDLAPADRARAQFMAASSLHRQGDNEGAAKLLRSFIDENPKDENAPEARYLLAVSLHALNRRPEAFAATLELLRVEATADAGDPKRWAYWQRRTGNQLANDFFESGDILSALTIYTRLAELSPEPGWRLPIDYQIGLCAERLGDPSRAHASYQGIVDGVGAHPPPELSELARRAAWRLGHLEWNEQTGRQVQAFFRTPAAASAASAAPAPAPTPVPLP